MFNKDSFGVANATEDTLSEDIEQDKDIDDEPIDSLFVKEEEDEIERSTGTFGNA